MIYLVNIQFFFLLFFFLYEESSPFCIYNAFYNRGMNYTANSFIQCFNDSIDYFVHIHSDLFLDAGVVLLKCAFDNWIWISWCVNDKTKQVACSKVLCERDVNFRFCFLNVLSIDRNCFPWSSCSQEVKLFRKASIVWHVLLIKRVLKPKMILKMVTSSHETNLRNEFSIFPWERETLGFSYVLEFGLYDTEVEA